MTTYWLYFFNSDTKTYTFEGTIKGKSYMMVRALIRDEIEIRVDKRWNHKQYDIGQIKVM